MSGIICFLRYLLMKITCAMRDAISTTRVMRRRPHWPLSASTVPVMGMSALGQKRTHAPQQASLFGAPN
jgi:hypothetical protein